MGKSDKASVGLSESIIDGLGLGKLSFEGDSVRAVGALLLGRRDGDQERLFVGRAVGI